MISLQNIVLTYPDGDSRITAVNNISLEVSKGHIVGITGPSGSGKSSLLAVASTLITPDSGRIILDGEDISGMSRSETSRLRREKMGIVFQQSNLIPSLKAWEQVAAVGEMSGLPRLQRKFRREYAYDLLESTGLEKHTEKYPHQLSGGQRQRVNICRALVNNPAVLVVDEPTASLDQQRGAEIIELIIAMTHKVNAATLLVTHDQEHLPMMDDVLTIVDGKSV